MKFKLFLLAMLAILAVSCTKTDDVTYDGKAKVQLVLTDAPAVYDAVNVEIKEIKFINAGDSTGWLTLPFTPKIFNLLDFRNGDYAELGELIMPEGNITGIRLVLGENNTIVVDGKEYPLRTPSAQKSGLKINFQQPVVADEFYQIWLDFDATRSVKKTGNSYMLMPVIKAFNNDLKGSVKGVVTPMEAKPIIYAMAGNDTVGTSLPQLNGFFKFVGLPEGTYSLLFDADNATGYKDYTLPNVKVERGKINDLGMVTLYK